ncbi:MAG: histidine kinase [Actinomycetota bacterium]
MTGSGRRTTVSDLIGRQPWIVVVWWLLFMIFPLISLYGSTSLTIERKIAATAGMAIFAVLYVLSFRAQVAWEERWRELAAVEHGSIPNAGRYFLGLVVATLATMAIGGLPAIGLVPFLVSFAVFNFSWPLVWVTIAGSVAFTIGVPLAADALGDLWFMTLIVVSVGAGTALIRMADAGQVEQSRLQTRLAVSDERTRVARDVHDVLGHSLTAVILKAELAERMLAGVDPEDEAERSRVTGCREQLVELQSISRSALAEIRATVGGLRAVNLADEVTVARTVLADAGVDLMVTGDAADVAEGDRPMLAWVVREAVTNVVRHARAERCHIELAPAVDGVLLRISDDGVGLGASEEHRNGTGTGHGLRGLRERVVAAGAGLDVRTDGGVVLEVRR